MRWGIFSCIGVSRSLRVNLLLRVEWYYGTKKTSFRTPKETAAGTPF